MANILRDTHFFQGATTKQVDGHTGAKAQPDAWYYEPADYDGDTLWSKPYATRSDAEEAARADLESGVAGG